MHLIHSYHLLDANFIESWNEASAASATPASTKTYTALQKQLTVSHPSDLSLTDIQRANLLITQQWLRLVVWQSSMRQGLLSSTSKEESMTFRYPLKIAHSLLTVISSLPTTSIEVHGMGMFEKIFEIGNTMLDVLQTSGMHIPHEIYGVSQDPFGMFIKTLSQTPNSQKQFATILLTKASEKPEIHHFASGLMPSLKDPTMNNPADPRNAVKMPFPTHGLIPRPTARRWSGSIVGEVDDNGLVKVEEKQDEQSIQEWSVNVPKPVEEG
jgi:hypothetical protein